MSRKQLYEGMDNAICLQLFEEFYGTAYVLACKMLRDRQIAIDIVRDTIYRVSAQAIGHFTDDEKKRYVLIAVKYSCLNYLKRNNLQRYHSEMEKLTSNQMQEESSVEEIYNIEHSYKTARSFIQHLPRIYKEIIELCVFKKLSDQDIASKLKIPVITVHKRKQRARELLLQIIRDKGFDPKSFLVASAVGLLLMALLK